MFFQFFVIMLVLLRFLIIHLSVQKVGWLYSCKERKSCCKCPIKMRYLFLITQYMYWLSMWPNMVWIGKRKFSGVVKLNHRHTIYYDAKILSSLTLKSYKYSTPKCKLKILEAITPYHEKGNVVLGNGAEHCINGFVLS